jgi:hypothetical protein
MEKKLQQRKIKKYTQNKIKNGFFVQLLAQIECKALQRFSIFGYLHNKKDDSGKSRRRKEMKIYTKITVLATH